MLLPREQSPWNCGYALGAIALRALSRESADLLDLRERMTELAKTEISVTQAVQALAWLYLLSAIELSEEGKITRCN